MASDRNDWRMRVEREADELRIKLDRLNAFLAHPDQALAVGMDNMLLLTEQRAFMRGYLDTLERRLLNA